MTPPNAKALLQTLEKNVKMFEEKHGKVKVVGQPDDKEGIGFKSG